MRILVVTLLMCTVFFASCLKKNDGCPYSVTNRPAPSSEEQAVLNYLTTNGITATKHGSNMYYEIISSGTGATPELCSGVIVQYSGKLASGTVFDSQSNAIFTLGSLIEGWKVGLPLIKKGGRIKLYIPPSLGYGAVDVKDGSGTVIIPGNSILIFDITLNDVQ
jgi:FKBP-type peptidyl-prolyl cis-trans isomerase FkpA